jgi:hypothetical protein
VIFNPQRRYRIMNAIRTLVVILCALGSMNASQNHAPDARALVRTAIDRMGGEKVLRSINTFRFTSAGYRNMLEQSERPEGPWIPSIELTTEAWDLQNGRWSSVADSRAGEFKFIQRQVVADGVAGREFDGRWSPGQPALVGTMEERFASAPFRALIAALDAPDLRAEADRTFQGVRHHVVSWKAKDGPTRLLLNTQTGYITAVETIRAYQDDLYWQVWGDVTTRTMFSYWAIEEGGVRLPRQWDVERNGLPESVFTIQSIELNGSLPADAFDIPDATRAAYKSAPQTTLDNPTFGSTTRPVRDLAAGVLEIPSSWDVTLVRQDDGIVVIEAPISAGYSRRVIEEAAKRFPGQPVKAVVSTSDSWPHFGGLREYVARGIPAYILDLNQPILSRAIAAPHTIHPDALAAKPRRPDFRVVSGKVVVGAGPNRLELYPVRGETGERMMAVYLPQHRLLYGSDLVQWGRGGPPEYVSELVDLAARERFEVGTVFAMHADPSPWSRVLAAMGKGTK